MEKREERGREREREERDSREKGGEREEEEPLTAARSCCVPPELKLTLEMVMVSPARLLILMYPFFPVWGSLVSP